MIKALLAAAVVAAAMWQFPFPSPGGGAPRVPPPPPPTGACTDNVNCFCDVVDHTGERLCEDFESVSYYENTSNGPISGSFDGSFWNRGGNSRWSLNYPGPASSSIFQHNDGEPTLGTRCSYGPGSPGGQQGCSGVMEWCSAAQGALAGAGVDCWGPNVNAEAGMDIQRGGDFDEDVPGLTLTGGTGAATNVLAGNQHLAYRIVNRTVGELSTGLGQKSYTNTTDIGIAMLHGYSSNIGTIGVINSGNPWKHEEWWSGSGYQEQWNMGMTGIGGAGDINYFPYQPLVAVGSSSNCTEIVAAATVHVGSIACFTDSGLPRIGLTANGSSGLTWFGSPVSTKHSNVTNYFQPTDFPFGTVACHRAHFNGVGLDDAELKIWNKACPTCEEKLVIHVSGMPLAGGGGLQNVGYSWFWWNAYANAANEFAVTGTGYRYRDNVHIRAGAPVSCAQIGF